MSYSARIHDILIEQLEDGGTIVYRIANKRQMCHSGSLWVDVQFLNTSEKAPQPRPPSSVDERYTIGYDAGLLTMAIERIKEGIESGTINLSWRLGDVIYNVTGLNNKQEDESDESDE